MNSLKNVRNHRRYEFYYRVANIVINGEIKQFIGIFELGNSNIHEFTIYFTDRMGAFTLRNRAFNTIKNFHLTYIIRFLNYIYNDSSNPINNIEELTLEMIQEFLDEYSRGSLSNDTNKIWKSRETVDRATYAISHFVYWLWWKKQKNSNKRKFKMKYIKKEDFQFDEETKKLLDIVTPVITTRNFIRNKVVSLGDYSISKLIQIANDNDPMLALGIVLGAYAGLRVGEITQMHEGRFRELYKDINLASYFDFTSQEILRSDNVVTSNIKTKRLIPIYPGCIKIISNYYERHIQYLKHKKLYPNKYGAIFIDNNGNAMKDSVYLIRFNKLNKLLDQLLKKQVQVGRLEAIREEQILSNNKVTPHSLRHYFKQLIERFEQDPRIVQYYMGHKSINSQDKYAISKSTEDTIRDVENHIYKITKDINFR